FHDATQQRLRMRLSAARCGTEATGIAAEAAPTVPADTAWLATHPANSQWCLWEGLQARSRAQSVRKLAEHRVHRAVPRAVEQLQLALGRGLPGFCDFQQRLDEAGFVHPAGIVPGAAAQPGVGD